MPAMSDDSRSSPEGDIPPKKPTKKSKAQAVAPEPEEDDEDEVEDEFAVEKIKNHRFEPDGTLKFFVKWLGYQEKDNTWEPEDNLDHCETELRAYYATIGGKPQFNEVKKATPASTKDQSKKRKHSQGPATDTATPVSSSAGKGRGQKKSKVDRNGSALDSFPSKSNWAPPQGSWEKDVVSIDTLEKDEDNEGNINAFVFWSSGHRSRHNLKVVNEKCPQKMLAFYEAHLQFNTITDTKPVLTEPTANAIPKAEEEFLEDDDEDMNIKPVASALKA